MPDANKEATLNAVSLNDLLHFVKVQLHRANAVIAKFQMSSQDVHILWQQRSKRFRFPVYLV